MVPDTRAYADTTRSAFTTATAGPPDDPDAIAPGDARLPDPLRATAAPAT